MIVIAVTGWAWRTPLGHSVDDAVARLLAGERAIAPNPRFDASTYACPLGAAMPGDPAPGKHARFLKRTALFGVEAGAEAFAKAKPAAASGRLGLFYAVGGLRAHWNDMLPALEGQQPDFATSWERGLKKLPPFWMLHHLSNNAHALLAADLAAKGDGITMGGANAGAQALAAACDALAAGSVDAAIVVAADSLLEPETLLEMGARGALCTASDPSRVAAPYSAAAAGLVPGEAVASVVLERAREAGSRALAFVEAAESADGQRSDARPTAVAATATRIARGDECVIDGAAYAHPHRDTTERFALGALTGSDMPLISIAAATGRLGAATSVVQVIALASLLRLGALPPIAALVDPGEGPLVPLTRRRSTTGRSALGVSMGAPGLAAAVRVSLP